MSETTFEPGTMGAAALEYTRRRLKIFPLWWAHKGVCACNDGPRCPSPAKHPRTGRGGVHLATTDPHQIAIWWALWPDAPIGLPAGANRLAIIDVDPAHGGNETLDVIGTWALAKYGIDIMATRTVRTGSGGLHLYYKAPTAGIPTKRQTFGVDAPGVDTRGVGGYVVAPPSIHATGGRYTRISPDETPAPWPAILSKLFTRPTAPTPVPATPLTPPTTRGAAWARAALDRECEALAALAGAPEGSGKNDRLNGAAYKLGRRVAAGLLDPRDVACALYNACAGWRGHTDRELRATIRSGLTAGMRKPHTGPTTQTVEAS